jgi:hypothetical protein
MTVDVVLSASNSAGRIVMKVIISALLALSVLAGIAAPASANYNPREDAGQSSPL